MKTKELYTEDHIMFSRVLDRTQLRSTTSVKSKLDLINFMVENDVNSKTFVEMGSYQGMTCYIMSHYFDKVIGLDIKIELAMDRFGDVDNINFIQLDLYDKNFDPYNIASRSDFVFIDANHREKYCLHDVYNALKWKPKYIGFDDYGHPDTGISAAVDKLVKQGHLKIIKEIGHYNLLPAAGGDVKLNGPEAVICEVSNFKKIKTINKKWWE